MLRESIGKTTNGESRLVTEEGGVPVTLGLKVTDPHKVEGCQYGDQDCWVEGSKCSEMNALYVITCKTCEALVENTERDNPKEPGGVKTPNYIGMTAGSLHARHKDHRDGHTARSKKNILVKHEMENHNGIPQEYSAKHIGREKGLLHLALKDAIMIESQVMGTSMNDRKEKGRSTGLIRVSTGIT